jgi:hypothetical protein
MLSPPCTGADKMGRVLSGRPVYSAAVAARRRRQQGACAAAATTRRRHLESAAG